MRPVRARLGPTGLVAAIVAVASRVPGAPTPARLEVTRTKAAATCPDEAKLRAKIAAKLGRDPFVAGGARRVRASFDRRGDTYEATVEIELGGARRVRTLTSPASDCRELAEATALTIALATDPMLGAEPPPATTTSPPSSTATTSSTSTPSSTPTTSTTPPSATSSKLARDDREHRDDRDDRDDRDRRRSRAALRDRDREPLRGADGPYLGLSLDSAVGAGPTLPIGLGFEFGVLARRLGFAIELHGRYGTMAAPTAGRVGVTWGYAAFVPCARFDGWYGCAVIGVGAERVRGDVELPRTATAAYVTPGLRLGGELPVGRGVSLFAQAELDAPIVRARVVVDGRNVFDPGPVVLVGAIGARMALP